jgi:flagellar biosynthesis protein FliQ
VAVLVVLGPWMLGQLETFTTELYGSIPQQVGR